MKIVLSGSTGFIGGGVLDHCLKHPSISSVIILTRRASKSMNHPKAKVLIVDDFISYDASVVEELKTVEAALWCLGTKTGDERVDIEFPLAFFAVLKSLPPRRVPFRYVQLGGAFTEPPPKLGLEERNLWFYANGRRIRGLTEEKVIAAAGKDLEVYLVKPGGVLPTEGSVLVKFIFGDSLAIRINELAATMIDLAVNGNTQQVFNNREIINHGRALL